MKKKIFCFMIAVVAVLATWNVSLGSKVDILPEFALANIEVLSQGENDWIAGYQSSKTITKYFYDDEGRLIRTETHTENCCVTSADYYPNCNYPEC